MVRHANSILITCNINLKSWFSLSSLSFSFCKAVLSRVTLLTFLKKLFNIFQASTGENDGERTLVVKDFKYFVYSSSVFVLPWNNLIDTFNSTANLLQLSYKKALLFLFQFLT